MMSGRGAPVCKTQAAVKAPAVDSLDGAPVVTAIAQVALACSDLVGVRRCADETPRRRRAGRLASALTTPRVAIVQEDPEQTVRDGHDAFAVAASVGKQLAAKLIQDN